MGPHLRRTPRVLVRTGLWLWFGTEQQQAGKMGGTAAAVVQTGFVRAPSSRRAASGRWLDRQFIKFAVLPTTLLMTCVFGIPLLFSGLLSFQGWAPELGLFDGKFVGMISSGIPTPAQPVFPTLELALRANLSQTLLGQKTPKQALDDVATDWRRGLRRGGITQ